MDLFQILQQSLLRKDLSPIHTAGPRTENIFLPVIEEQALLRDQLITPQKLPINRQLRFSHMNLIGNHSSVQVLHEICILRVLVKQLLRIIGKNIDPVTLQLQKMHHLPDPQPRQRHVLAVQNKPGNYFRILRIFLSKLLCSLLRAQISKIKFMPEVLRIIKHLRTNPLYILFLYPQIPQEISPAKLNQYISQIKN